jgi:hypothetical protein
MHSGIIPVDLDKRYRWAIVEYAKNMACLPETLVREFERVLESPTARPEAFDESNAVLGKELDEILPRTGKIVTALAFFLRDKNDKAGIGFIKWLGASGWGNDVRLIRLFDAWAQEADRRKRLKAA